MAPSRTAAGKDAEEPEYRENADIDEQMSEEERRRLLYVALTRAEDHLIVSTHRSDRDRGSLAGLVANEIAVMAEPPPTLEPEWVEPGDAHGGHGPRCARRSRRIRRLDDGESGRPLGIASAGHRFRHCHRSLRAVRRRGHLARGPR